MLQLNLDGIYCSSQILKGHVDKIDGGKCSCFHDLYAKVSAPIQIVLVLVDTVATQTLRGLCFVVGGALSRNGSVFKKGFWEFLSVAVQIVALPIIAVISIFHTQTASDKAYALSHIIKTSASGKEYPAPNISYFALDDKRSSYVPAILMHLLSVPLISIRMLTNAPIKFLNWEILEAGVAVIGAVAVPLIELVEIPPCLHKTRNIYLGNAFEYYDLTFFYK